MATVVLTGPEQGPGKKADGNKVTARNASRVVCTARLQMVSPAPDPSGVRGGDPLTKQFSPPVGVLLFSATLTPST